MLRSFHSTFPDICIQCILADGLYGHAEFVDEASAIFGGIQVITKMKNNQNVHFQNKNIPVSEFFRRYPPVLQKVQIRGGEEIEIFVSSARLNVHSHGKKRFIIAIRYQDEEECRYLLASDLSWRTLDIVQAFFFRWLIEVFFEDWKGYEGSRRSLILSLLLDHALLFHHDQKAHLENKLPALSVGSLSQRIQAEALVQFVQDISKDGLDEDKIQKLKENIDNVIPLNTSKKHMSSRTVSNMKAAPSLERFKKAS